MVGGSAVEGRGFVIMLDKFCSPASILGGASDSVHRQSGRCTRWRASCAFLCCAERQVPTVLSWCRVLGTERGCSMEACERISHIFYVLLALFAWNLDLISCAPCSGNHSTLCVATVHGCSWTNFVYFLREKWTRSSPRSSHLEI